ncbi:hypothetical protein FYK55_04415 [Roseiconus nitratireducens]|uniref:Parallel beta helix pectate lyase-like protein n=1 Tax=Roseiconus nitratireducens TaxID=2605748 RepID=A0A5M6DLB9_9BACT|nr:hypothetical protein [Roseiconus nitratireducens]KAA5546145.1 hypothetical protein FYK55_04415 [Roseiconus nitratireducens]
MGSSLIGANGRLVCLVAIWCVTTVGQAVQPPSSADGVPVSDEFREMKNLLDEQNGFAAASDGPVIDVPLTDTDNYHDVVKDALEEASGQSGATVRFPENALIPVRPRRTGARHIKMEGLRNCEVDLNGSTIEFDQVSLGILIDDCESLTIRNGTIVGAGRLASRAEFDKRRRCFVITDHDVPVEKLVTVGTVPAAGELYREIFVNRGKDVQWRYDRGKHAFVYRGGPFPDWPDGQRVILQHENNQGHAIKLDAEKRCRNITLSELVLVNIPGMGIVGEVDEGLTIDRVAMLPHDDAVMAVASDGIHVNHSGGGITISNCTIEFSGDDKVNLNSRFWMVEEVSGNRMIVGPVDRPGSISKWGDVGDDVVFSTDTFEPIGDRAWTLSMPTTELSGKRHELLFTESVQAIQPGTLVVNRDRTSSGSVIRDNRFIGTRGSGVKMNASDALIEDNDFENCYSHAVVSQHASDLFWEGVFPHEITLRNNRAVGCGRHESKSKPNQDYYFEEGVESVTIE